MTAQQLIAFLNALTLGDRESLLAKLEEARAAVAALGHDDLAGTVGDARGALLAGDVKKYRKKVETAIARLGHLKGS